MREKLIEILRKPIFPHELVDPIEAVADYLLDNGVTIQEWIPVTERLPETFGEFTVAVKTENGRMFSDYADYDPYKQSFRTSMFIGLNDVITHWMPLPTPPKGE